MQVLFGCFKNGLSFLGIVYDVVWDTVDVVLLNDLMCGISEESFERFRALSNNTEGVL